MKSAAARQVPVGHPGQGSGAGTATDAAPTVLGPDGARGEVIHRLLVDGPSTASTLASALGVSGTAVRRQLDALVADGSVTTRDETVRGARGRGRPAQVYLLTEAGRRRLPHAYDELAEQALDYLQQHGGPQAVAEFARQRATMIVDGVADELATARSVGQRARILATALSQSGFVANVESVAVGEQLSQHHCPVAHVARKYPQLCEQELAVFREALGTYAQRLATIARGDSFCTTFIPPDTTPASARTAAAPNGHGRGVTPTPSMHSNGRTS